MEIRTRRGFPPLLENSLGDSAFSQLPQARRRAKYQPISTAAIHLKNRDFLSEEWGAPQGAQFTSDVFTRRLEDRAITIGMDGRGRFLDNIFVERLWRTVKYEEVYLKDYLSVPEAISNLNLYFRHYNQERGHQAFDYRTPEAVYFQRPPRACGN